jgi:hypothetical protein
VHGQIGRFSVQRHPEMGALSGLKRRSLLRQPPFEFAALHAFKILSNKKTLANVNIIVFSVQAE